MKKPFIAFAILMACAAAAQAGPVAIVAARPAPVAVRAAPAAVHAPVAAKPASTSYVAKPLPGASREPFTPTSPAITAPAVRPATTSSKSNCDDKKVAKADCKG